jgi:hypothetical protein
MGNVHNCNSYVQYHIHKEILQVYNLSQMISPQYILILLSDL